MFGKILITLLVFVFTITLSAQEVVLKGKTIDSFTKVSLINATVQLLDKDSTVRYYYFTTKSGEFEITQIKPGSYNLKITYIGYERYERQIQLRGRDKVLDLGVIELIPVDVKTDEVEVSAASPMGEQIGDTTQFAASSFKTTKDATTEELIRKMPGIEVDAQGKVKAQGEEVKKVMVDGKPFFGEDPTLALRNLPADVVDRVQVYDRSSEQAEFTGFDDGERTKTLNIITKENRRTGQFGKFSGGYAYEDKYQLNLNLNLFNGPQRISVLGMSNNVNQQNFSIMDILDMMGGTRGRMLRQFAGSGAIQALGSRMSFGIQRSGAGNFFSSQQDGISTTHALGVNYSDYWTNNLEVSGSYFLNYSNNKNNSLTNRTYLFPQDSNQLYNSQDYNLSDNSNHRFNLKLDWYLDTNTSIMIRPNVTFQNNTNTNEGDAYTQSFFNTVINSSNSDYNLDSKGYNLSNEILFKHRLGVIGRTISVNATTGIDGKEGAYNLYNINSYAASTSDTVNQQSSSPQNGYSLRGNISYTEPIHQNGQLMVSYLASLKKNTLDQRTYNFNLLSNDYDIIDSLTSNNFDNDYFYQKGGLAYRYKIDNLIITSGLDYQIASLLSDQVFPTLNEINYKFYNLLPSIRLNYRPDKTTNIFFRYSTSTDAPSVQQLQNLLDNSNPLQLSIGNPELKQQLSNNLSFRYNNFSQDFNNIFFAFISLTNRKNFIGTSSILSRNDTIINDSYIIPAGAQLTLPVNLEGFWNAVAVLNYGFPLSFIKSKFNLNLSGFYTRTPGLINNFKNYSNSYNYSGMITLTSNVSENLDFNLTSRINFNNTINSVQKSNNLNYYNLMNIFNFKWIFFEGFFLQGDIRNENYAGDFKPVDANYTLINLSIGKKLFKDDTGEIKFSVYDLLNNSKSNATNLTEFYTENVYNQVLERYLMLTFTYNLRNFKF